MSDKIVNEIYQIGSSAMAPMDFTHGYVSKVDLYQQVTRSGQLFLRKVVLAINVFDLYFCTRVPAINAFCGEPRLMQVALSLDTTSSS